jgi:predicted ester cyclase
MGFAPTHKTIAFGTIMAFRFVDGRIVEHRGELDSAGLVQQLTAPAQDHTPFVTELFRRIDSHDLAGAREMIAPDGRFCLGNMTLDRDGWVGFSQQFFAAFPDGKHNHQIVNVGDRAMEIGHFTGTHRGEFQGIPATNRQVKFTYIGLTHVVNGKVAEQRVEADFAALMQQLG